MWEVFFFSFIQPTMSLRLLSTRSRPIPHARLRSSTPPSEYSRKLRSSFRTYTSGLALTFGLGFGYAYWTDSSAAIHSAVVMPVVRALTDAEDSHRLAVEVLKFPFGRPYDKSMDTESLAIEVRP